MKKKESKTLVMGFVVLISAVIVIGLLGYFILTPSHVILQGEFEANEVRVSGKLPGRILELRTKEGERVRKGDTLVIIDSPEIYAKLDQAQAAEDGAKAISMKAQKGTRKEQIAGALEQVEMAEAVELFAKKTYDRMSNLFKKGVISSQKFDEVEAQYKASVSRTRAAKSQYEMALNGAQTEDKLAAVAQVNRAKGAVSEASSYLSETKLVAPISGEISDIFPKVGELIGSGSPIMNIVDMDEVWVTFNVREDLLSKIKVGTVLSAKVPALGNKEIKIKVSYIKALGSYATWKATKLTDQYDTKTFELRAIPTTKDKDYRPGMSVIVNWTKIK
ncbi:MAG: efflux RND transporter periplasmic adaptor subunit [Bacteroidales bacterium]|nr:efflux RND transporter periplasmic adaptor subunit [Bacteroidales bacterium]